MTVGALTVGALTVGALTVGALTVGALTVGALTVGALTVGALTVGALTVGALTVELLPSIGGIRKRLTLADVSFLYHPDERVAVLAEGGDAELYEQVLVSQVCLQQDKEIVELQSLKNITERNI